MALLDKTLASLNTDDVRISSVQEVVAPSEIMGSLPVSNSAAEVVISARKSIKSIIHGTSDKLLVIIGPCSIHDPAAGLDYAEKLLRKRIELSSELEIVMRVYFEKPRTTVGWKGLINDPDLNNSFDINRGLNLSRELLRSINELGLPAGVEFLDVISPQYIADLVSWGAIGARTTESQVHRELASGLSCPVGFKNGTSGSTRVAIDALRAAGNPHHFLSVTKSGRSAIVSTSGNMDCHIILRGGVKPNFDVGSCQEVVSALKKFELPEKIMIDLSHGNSGKDHKKQAEVCCDVSERISNGDSTLVGVMIESHLIEGRQDLKDGFGLNGLTYGQSITDACLSWHESCTLLDQLANSVIERRKKG